MLTNVEIETHVNTIIKSYLEGVKQLKRDEKVIDAGSILITNFLTNMNDIAAHARRT